MESLPDIIRTVNRVFRPASDPLGGMAHEFPAVFSSDNASNLYYMSDREGTPVSHVGVAKFTGVLDCARISMASIGAVCTLPEYQKRGLSSKILEKVITDLEAEEVGLMLVSGRRGLYSRLGCAEAGNIITAYFEKSSSQQPGISYDTRIREIPREDFGKNVDKLLALYRCHRHRYSRSKELMLALLKGYSARRKEVGVRLYEVLSSGMQAGYVLTSLGERFEREPGTLRIPEWAGSASSVISALPLVIEEYGVERARFQVQPSDINMVSCVRRLGLKTGTGPVQGTVRPVSVSSLIHELGPWFEEYLGYRVELMEESREGWLLRGPFGESKLKGFAALTKWLFDPSPSGLGVPLMFTDDMNYV